MNISKYPCPELVVQTAGLPDAGSDLTADVPFASFGIELEERFRAVGDVHFRLHISAVKNDVLVKGGLSFEAEALCDRCAEWSKVALEAKELFYRFKNRLGEAIDLTDGVREDIVLAFPQSHLCREDCRGLCPQCGQNLNLGGCSCPQTESAPQEMAEGEGKPWAALDELKLP